MPIILVGRGMLSSRSVHGLVEECFVASYTAATVSCRFYDLANSIYNEIGLFHLAVMSTILCDDLL